MSKLTNNRILVDLFKIYIYIFLQNYFKRYNKQTKSMNDASLEIGSVVYSFR